MSYEGNTSNILVGEMNYFSWMSGVDYVALDISECVVDLIHHVFELANSLLTIWVKERNYLIICLLIWILCMRICHCLQILE